LGTSYHLIGRNCNHFTETLGTSLCTTDEIARGEEVFEGLKSYPPWVNRLARTGGGVGFWGESDCDVIREAKEVSIGWGVK